MFECIRCKNKHCASLHNFSISLLVLHQADGVVVQTRTAHVMLSQIQLPISKLCGVLQEEFGALLPLYLTAAHFNQALPHMELLLKLLAPELVSTRPLMSQFCYVRVCDVTFSTQ